MANPIDIHKPHTLNQTLTDSNLAPTQHDTSSRLSDDQSFDLYSDDDATPNFASTLTRFPLFAFLMMQGCSPEEPVYNIDPDDDGFVAPDDCNDENDQIHPNANEFCNSIDDNCDGNIDENAIDRKIWLKDSDNDGFGDPTVTTEACNQPNGYVSLQAGDDCNDNDSTINPNTVWYLDNDGDDYGNPEETTQSCTKPAGHTAIAGDCNDENEFINPLMPEICDDNNVDENCNGTADNDDLTADPSGFGVWYADLDSDGFGDSTNIIENCDQPDGSVTNTDDCLDSEETVYPGATDTRFDGIDASCSLDSEELQADVSNIIFTASSNDYLGFGAETLTNLGDINGDGHDDLGIGVSYSDLTDINSGAVAVIYGGSAYSTSLSIYDANVIYTGTIAGEGAGQPVATAGDVNNDGFQDMLIGTLGYNKVYLVSGEALLSDTSFSTSTAIISNIYASSLSSGDFNNDGYSDIVLGDNIASKIYVFNGPLSGELSTTSDANTTLTASAIDYLGSTMVVHDVNGDGHDDLISAAEEFDGANGLDSGRVCITLGPLSSESWCNSAHLIIDGAASKEFIAQTLKMVPDIDGDGREELLIGAAYTGPHINGKAFLISSSDLLAGGYITTASALTDFIDVNDGLGLSAATGDFNNDGVGDFCLGSSQSDVVASNTGKIDCFDGSQLSAGTYDLSTDSPTSRIHGLAANDLFGTSVLIMDLDDDGQPELMSGAANASSFSGQIYVLENDFY